MQNEIAAANKVTTSALPGPMTIAQDKKKKFVSVIHKGIVQRRYSTTATTYMVTTDDGYH